jgi:hypothetical protein
MCLAAWSADGISPSCSAERFPPGKTCADAKEEDVFTRERRSISFLGDTRRMLVLF